MTRSAREIAVASLADRSGNVTAHLERLLRENDLSAEDVALAQELALGTLRRRGTLRAIVRSFLKHPQLRLAPSVELALLVAAYQVILLDRVPDFAAVNEAVNLIGRRHARMRGMVNGVLRSLCRAVTELKDGPAPVDASAIPVGPGTHRLIDRPVFEDPASDPAAYLAAAYSLPPQLAQRWLTQHKRLGRAVRVAAATIARPPMIARVNPLRAGVEDVIASVGADGAVAHPHRNGRSVVFAGHVNVTSLAAFRAGLIQPQDPTATAAACACGVAPGMRVLDLCSAPGTKTTCLAENMMNDGEIVAVDVSAEKLSRVQDSCARMGITIVKTCLAADLAGLEQGSFDVVLADVPCSNTGVLARRAEARWRFEEKHLRQLVRDQRILGQMALVYARPGGRVVYSTCSVEPDENQGLVKWLTRQMPSWKLTRDERTLPNALAAPADWQDGGYYAILG